MRAIEFSGQNIGTYEVIINSLVEGRRRTWFGGNLSGEFFYDSLTVTTGLVIELKVEHNRPMTGDFEGRILGFIE